MTEKNLLQSASPGVLRRSQTIHEGGTPLTLIHLHANTLIRREKSVDSIASDPNVPPKPEALNARRDALVPEENKVFDENHDPSSKCDDSESHQCDNVIIIPQMQISAHDLHLYNRAITNKGGILNELQKATTAAQAFYNEDVKKPKAPWILKRLYDWSHRSKTREVVRHVRKALDRLDKEFVDESLLALLTQNWTNFYGDNWQIIPDLERKRLQAVWELFHSEVVFLYQHLLALRNVYKEPLKECQVEGYLLSVEPELLFGNLEELCQVSFAFCEEFHKLLKQSLVEKRFSDTQVVEDVFNKFSKNLSPIAAYQAYCINYKATLEYLETIRKTDDRFIEFEKLCAQDPRCNRLLLDDLLIVPLHRITRLPILLKEILKYTPNVDEKHILETIIETMHESLLVHRWLDHWLDWLHHLHVIYLKQIHNPETFLVSIDESIQWLHNFERLQELQKQLSWPSIQETDPKTYVPEFLKLAVSRQYCENLLAHPRRKLVHEGLLYLVESQKQTEIYAFLFNDMFLLTKSRKGSMRVKNPSQTRPNCISLDADARSNDPSYKFIVQKQPVPLDSCVFCDVGPQDISNSYLKHAFVVLHLTRFYQLVAVYTFQTPNKEAKETWIRKFQESIENYESIQLKDMLRCTPLVNSSTRTCSRSPSRRTSSHHRNNDQASATAPASSATSPITNSNSHYHHTNSKTLSVDSSVHL